jgi:hypothetical protein
MIEDEEKKDREYEEYVSRMMLANESEENEYSYRTSNIHRK